MEFQFDYKDGLVQNCSNSSALGLELQQSCTKPSIYIHVILSFFWNHTSTQDDEQLF